MQTAGAGSVNRRVTVHFVQAFDFCQIPANVSFFVSHEFELYFLYVVIYIAQKSLFAGLNGYCGGVAR